MSYCSGPSSTDSLVEIPLFSKDLPSLDDTLSALSLSAGTLSPVFASGTTSYTASVSTAVSSLTVTPTVSHGSGGGGCGADTSSAECTGAAVTVNGAAVSSGSASSAITLSAGSNTITIVVTAEDDGHTPRVTETYTVVVTQRMPPGAPTAVTAAAGDDHGELTVGWTAPTGMPTPTGYQVRWCPHPSYDTGTTTTPPSCTAGASSSWLPSNAGQATGSTTASYTITGLLPVVSYAVQVAASAGGVSSAWAAPSSVVVPQGERVSTLQEAMTAGAGACSGLTLGMTLYNGARGRLVYCNGQNFQDLSIHADMCRGGLQYNSTAKTVTFCASGANQGMEAQGFYRPSTVDSSNNPGGSCSTLGAVAVHVRASGRPVSYCDGSTTVAVPQFSVLPSLDATLSALSLSEGTLSPAFASGTPSYTAMVGNAVSSVTVTPTVSHASGGSGCTTGDTDPHCIGATVTVDDTAVSSGAASEAITLEEGDNTIEVVVTAEDDGHTPRETQTYTVVVTRAPRPGVTVSVGTPSGVLTVTEGGMASYTVVLDGAPSDDVTITPASSDTAAAGVSTARPDNTLLFGTDDWNSARTVTVTGEQDADGMDAEGIVIRHTVSSTDAGYAGLSAAALPTVTVEVDDDELPSLVFAAGEARVVEGEAVVLSLRLEAVLQADSSVQVAVSHAPPLTAGEEDYRPLASNVLALAMGERDFAVTLETAQDEEQEEDETLAVVLRAVASAPYRLGTPEGVIVTIADDDAPGASAAQMVNEALLPETARVLAGVSVDAVSRRVGRAAAERGRLRGEAAASGGRRAAGPASGPVSGSASGSAPAGSGPSAVSPVSGSLSGSVSGPLSGPAFRLAPPAGGPSAAAPVPGGQQAAADGGGREAGASAAAGAGGASAGRLRAALQAVGEGDFRSLAASGLAAAASSATGPAAGSGRAGRSGSAGLADWARSAAGGLGTSWLRAGELDLRSLANAGELVLPLGSGRLDAAPGSALSGLSGLSALGLSAPVLWFGTEYRELSGQAREVQGEVDWDGHLFSASGGVDAWLRDEWLVGLAGTWGRSRLDYTMAEAGASGSGAASAESLTGRYTLELYGVYPYVSWLPRALAGRDVQLWATGGYGWGEARLRGLDGAAAGTATGAGAVSGDVRQWLLGVGGSGRLWQSGEALSLRWKLDGSQARMTLSGDAGGVLQGVEADSGRYRALLGVEQALLLSGGGELRPSLEAGVRVDTGDGNTGAGAELGVALDWRDAARGLRVETEGRAFAGRGADLELGAALSLEWAPDAGGPGPFVRLRPGYGVAASGVSRLWEQGASPASGLQTAPAAAAAPVSRLEMEWGYGLRPRLVRPGGGGLLVAYVNNRLGLLWRHRVGLRWALAQGLHLHLFTERRQRPGQPPEHSLLLESQLNL